MKTPVRAAVAAAAIAGAGLAGFGLTSALAQEDPADDATTTTEAPADDDRGERPHRGGHCAGGPALDAMAEAIGIDAEELRTALQEGQTPAEVAEANGVSRGELVDAVVADIDEHLDEAVEEGRLTEEEAAERRADVEEHAGAIVDGERPEGFGPPPGPPGGPGRGAPGEPPAEEAPGEG